MGKTSTRRECLFVGFDPGQTGGGLAWIYGNGNDRAGFVEMPSDCHGIPRFLEGGRQNFKPRLLCGLVERVGIRPGENLGAAADFCRNFGRLEASLCILADHWDTIAPVTWQRYYDLFGRGWEPIEKKNHHKALAQSMFPQLEVTHAGADALLIADYCRRYFAEDCL